MKSKKEIKRWLLANAVDIHGNLDLSELDFSDFEGNVDFSEIKVKNNLYQNYQEVGGDLEQEEQKVGGSLSQERQEVKGDLFQHMQIVEGVIYNHKPREEEFAVNVSSQFSDFIEVKKFKDITKRELEKLSKENGFTSKEITFGREGDWDTD